MRDCEKLEAIVLVVHKLVWVVLVQTQVWLGHRRKQIHCCCSVRLFKWLFSVETEFIVWSLLLICGHVPQHVEYSLIKGACSLKQEGQTWCRGET